MKKKVPAKLRNRWPKLTRAQISGKVREYLGTPFRWRGRVKGAGVDCFGLIFCVFRDLGVHLSDPLDDGQRYRPDSQSLSRLKKVMGEAFDLVEDLKPGDAFLLGLKDDVHCGFQDEGEFVIHAINGSTTMRVCEGAWNEDWRKSIVARYRYKGLKDG